MPNEEAIDSQRHLRAVVHHVLLADDLPIEEKAKGLGLTVGGFLEFCWNNDMMPHPGETPAMKLSIRNALRETLHGKSVNEAAEELGVSKETVGVLLGYRGARKVRFFRSAAVLQTIYELFKAGWTDEDISEALQIEGDYIAVITDLFFKRKQTTIGFQAR